MTIDKNQPLIHIPKNQQQWQKCDQKKGRNIASLEYDLKKLDVFEKSIKNKMHDRMKFMSGRNAQRMEQEINLIEKKKEAIRREIALLQ